MEEAVRIGYESRKSHLQQTESTEDISQEETLEFNPPNQTPYLPKPSIKNSFTTEQDVFLDSSQLDSDSSKSCVYSTHSIPVPIRVSSLESQTHELIRNMTDSLQSEETTLSQPIMDSISDLCNEMMMNIHPLIAEPPHLHEMSTETNISYIEQKMTEFEQKSHEFMDKMKNKTLNISDPLQQLIKLEKRMQIINELVSTHFAPPLLRSNAVEKFKTAKQAVLDDQLLRYSLQLTQVAPLLSTTNLLVSRLASLSDAHEQAFKLSSIIQNVEQDRHAMKMQLDTIETQLDKALHSANEASKQIQSNYTFLKQRIGAT